MSRKEPWFKFYPADWRADPRLRMCSIGARGLWAEMLCVMHEAEPYGYLLSNDNIVTSRQMAALAGISVTECMRFMLELASAGVYSIDESKRIFSRRMVRDKAKAENDRTNGKGGGHPDIRRGTVPKEQRVRRFRRSDAPEKAKRIFSRSAGNCHWCKEPLNEEDYHIDHLVAVRDGGTNDESNLVAACPDCNGERAMTWGRNDSDLMRGKKSDHKAQKPEARSHIPEKDSEANASGAVAPRDVRAELFGRGLQTLARLTGKGPDSCRSFVGKCLKAAGDDAVTVLGLIEDAERNRVVDPSAWIVAGLKATGPPTARPLTEFQRGRNETKEILNDLGNYATGGGGGEENSRVLRGDTGERSEGIRGGAGAYVIDLPAIGHRQSG